VHLLVTDQLGGEAPEDDAALLEDVAAIAMARAASAICSTIRSVKPSSRRRARAAKTCAGGLALALAQDREALR